MKKWGIVLQVVNNIYNPVWIWLIIRRILINCEIQVTSWRKYFEAKKMIERSYNIQIKSMQEIQGGWSALAYKVIAENGVFFLKAYEKHKHTAKALCLMEESRTKEIYL